MTEITDLVKNWILKANNDYKTGKDEMETEILYALAEGNYELH